VGISGLSVEEDFYFRYKSQLEDFYKYEFDRFDKDFYQDLKVFNENKEE
jgi:hypothetical protein